MGAAASMKMVYAESLLWFRQVRRLPATALRYQYWYVTTSYLLQYFDEMTYAEDFHALDKNGDGGVVRLS
jgi:hypothetical protein